MIYNKHWLATLTGFPGGASGKNLLANAGNSRDTGSIPGLGGSPGGEGMVTHSTILVWRIPWTEKPGGLQSIGLHRVWTQLKRLITHTHTHTHTQQHL